jgi:hypothetical protein
LTIPGATQLFKTNPWIVLSNVVYTDRPYEWQSLTAHILPHAIAMYVIKTVYKNKHTKYFYNCEKVFLSELCHILGRYINTVEKKRRELKTTYNVTPRRGSNYFTSEVNQMVKTYNSFGQNDVVVVVHKC